MRGFIITACFVVAAMAQGSGGSDRPDWFNNIASYLDTNDDVVDRFHEYRFEYHRPPTGQHLMIAIDDKLYEKECHFMEINEQWEFMLTTNSTDLMHAIVESFYTAIHNPNVTETTLSTAQLSTAYGDADATKECFGHKIFITNWDPTHYEYYTWLWLAALQYPQQVTDSV